MEVKKAILGIALFLVLATAGVLAYHMERNVTPPGLEEKWRWKMPEIEKYEEKEKYIEIYKEIITKQGVKEIEHVVEIEGGMVRVVTEVEIEMENKTIEVRHERLLNQTVMIINKEIEVEIEGNVIVDKEKKKIVIIRNNKTVEIEEDDLDDIERAINETVQKVMRRIMEKVRNMEMVQRMVQERVQYEVQVLDNDTVVVKTKVPVRARILWIIPVTLEIEYERIINLQTGIQMEQERMPWWARIFWALITIETT